MSILNYIPGGFTPRPVQKKVLLEVENNWKEYDTLVIDAPVASGKSLIAVTIANWRNSMDNTAAILTPQALLQDQYQETYPNIPSLKGKHKYLCSECKKNGYKSCGEFNDISDMYWDTCEYPKAVNTAKIADQLILNFHSHLFSGMTHKTYKDTLIIDEAHNLIPMLSDVYTLHIWLHKEPSMKSTATKDDIVCWLDEKIIELTGVIGKYRSILKEQGKLTQASRKKLLDATRLTKRYKMIQDGLVVREELFHISERELVYGHGRKKHKCIEIQPTSLKTVPHAMWPKSSTKKLVLMSATIYEDDIRKLGLHRVKYITCDSPIPSESRPIYVDPVGPMTFKEKDNTIPIMCKRIEEIANHHDGKGLVHITYGLARDLKKYLKGGRYLWHDNNNKEEVYDKFLNAKEPYILMACGMSEGIDLAGEEFSWQVIAKTIFPSLADPIQKHFIHKDPIVYTLSTVRTTVQQVGRICRTPTDQGATYILDSSFAAFYRRGTKVQGKYTPNYKLFPAYFMEAMKWK